ncbi:MAG: acylneuraminate cytidylyltransferase family protein [Leptolinea sp.]|jgi:CMP-N-acetylneuraminic acid synthetase|nr:acylneuraminate cytidylyltransferase family protein [Leptolinea sp.]
MSLDRIVALVPMRHHSQRVPGKNYRLIAGKPLFHHILDTLLQCAEISKIVIDTDSPDIRQGVATEYPSVDVLERPDHLRADDISMNEVLLYDTSRYPADLYLQTHSTNPLLKIDSVREAVHFMQMNYPAYDSLFSVTKVQRRLYDELARPINHNPNILLQTQDLPPVYEENSCLYIFSRETLEKRRTRIGDRPRMFVLDAVEAWDIDEEMDFRIAELMLQAG